MAIAGICEFAAWWRQFLQTLSRNRRKIPCEFCKFRQNHSSSRYEAINQRLLPHLFSILIDFSQLQSSFFASIQEFEHVIFSNFLLQKDVWEENYGWMKVKVFIFWWLNSIWFFWKREEGREKSGKKEGEKMFLYFWNVFSLCGMIWDC